VRGRRDEIAECSEKSYVSLPLPAGQKLLNFRSQEDFVAYAQQVPLRTDASSDLEGACFNLLIIRFLSAQRGWEVKDGRVNVQKKEGDNKAQVPSLQIIAQTLQYVKELERIV
jgi:hypothetical protein